MISESNAVRSSTSFTEDEQHVAGNAYNFFRANQFDATLAILKKLQKAHPNDIRLLHNKILTEFCKSGKTKIQEFKRNLAKVQKQLYQIAKDDDEAYGSIEKNNHFALSFNQAVLLYSLHQYSDTETLLEKMYEHMDTPEDFLFLKICLLLVDTYLHSFKAEKANNLISTIEKYLQNMKTKDNNDEKAHGASADTLQLHLRYLKSRCFLQLKSLKACKKEMKFFGNSGSPATGAPGFVGVASVFLKSNIEYVRCNYHKAYRILGSSPPPPSNQAASNGTHDGLAAMFYNNLALIHFHMGKYTIGSFYMQKALYENDVAVQAATKQYYSSLTPPGGRHHQQQVPIGKPLSVLAMNKKFELLYNCGLQFLFAGNPSQAFDCLLAALPAFRDNPRLWLRLAECCIHKCTECASDASAKSKKSAQSQNIVPFSVVGKGNHQKVVVNTPQPIGGKINNFVTPAPTLQFASTCLKNALTIITLAINNTNERNEQQDKDAEHLDNKVPEKYRTVVPCPPGAPVSGPQLDHLHSSVLINGAFVALSLDNHLLALEYAQALQALSSVSGCHRYLANLYAAEALVSLDRISDAIPYMSVDKTTSISTDVEESGKKSPVSDDGSIKSNHSNQSHQCTLRRCSYATQWSFPPNLTCAHGYMLINLANAHSLRSEHQKALHLVQQAASMIGSKQLPPQALPIAVYSHLLSGGEGISTALQLLKYNVPVLTSSDAEPQALNGKAGNGNNSSSRSLSAGGNASTGTGSNSNSSASSTTSSAPRSKSSTPQPSAGGVTPERSVKTKTHDKKRNRR